jgi:MYXO-CTERM domain-containing protein
MNTRTKILLGTALATCLVPLAARAHWCGDLWASSYNIVVRPATDTVTVPSSGSANLDIFVQNNMGYLLDSFTLTAQIGTTKITATRQTQKVANMLLPGEKAKYTLSVTKSGGGAVSIGDISFLVSFGGSGQSDLYGKSPGKAVMIRKTDGSLVPAPPPPGVGTGGDQARQLQYTAMTDFSDVNAGLDKLMLLYCAGRASWNSGSDAVIAPACTGTATDCTKGTRALSAAKGSKYDYTHLWAAMELVVRKGSLGTRLSPLRQRLQCGASDPNVGFAGFAMMMLGYLGDDSGARTFLEGKANSTTDLGLIAEAALMLFGAADAAKYKSDVTTKGLVSKTQFVAAASAAALGISQLDDASVTSALLPLAKWTEPDTDQDNGQGLYASHLLALVAWDRRCWAAQGADVGPVTFYEGGTPARTCTSVGPGTGGSTGGGGSTGAGGSTGSAGSTGLAGNTAAGGKTGTSSGASAGMPAGGGKTAISAGGSVRVGGSSGAGSGGSVAPPPSGGSPDTGQNTGVGTGGSQGSSSASEPSGSTGGDTATGGITGAGSGGGAGNGSPPGSGNASSSGSAGGCGFVPSGQATIPLGFLLAGVGLALAVRRRRR